MNDRQFDEFIRQKVDAKEFAYSEAYWMGAEELIRQNIQARRRRRFFLLFFTVFGLLTIGGGYWWTSQNSNLFGSGDQVAMSTGSDKAIDEKSNGKPALAGSYTGDEMSTSQSGLILGNNEGLHDNNNADRNSASTSKQRGNYSQGNGDDQADLGGLSSSQRLNKKSGSGKSSLRDQTTTKPAAGDDDSGKGVLNGELESGSLSAVRASGDGTSSSSIHTDNRSSMNLDGSFGKEQMSQIENVASEKLNANLSGKGGSAMTDEAQSAETGLSKELENDDLLGNKEVRVQNQGENPESLKNQNASGSEPVADQSDVSTDATKSEESSSSQTSAENFGQKSDEDNQQSSMSESSKEKNLGGNQVKSEEALKASAQEGNERAQESESSLNTTAENQNALGRIVKETSTSFAQGLTMHIGGHALDSWEDDASAYSFGPSIGLLSLSDIGKRWTFEAGLIYAMRGGAGSRTETRNVNFDFGFESETITYDTRSLNYFEIPLRVGAYLNENRRHYLAGGVTIIQLASANNRVTTLRESSLENAVESRSNRLFKADGYLSQDLGINLLYAYRLNNKFAFNLEYRFGLRDNTDNSYFLTSGIDRNSGLMVALRYSPFKS